MIRSIVAGACIVLMALLAVLTWIWAGIETATVDPTPVLTIVPASPTVYVFPTMTPTAVPERLPARPTPTTVPAVRILDTPEPTMTPPPSVLILDTPVPTNTKVTVQKG